MSRRSRQRRPTLSARSPGPVALSQRGLRSSILCELASERIAEAKLLLSHEHFTGAAYIAGYAVELLLKAVIATKHSAGYWPLVEISGEYRTHNLNYLLRIADLDGQMRRAEVNNFELVSNWATVRTWETNFRYRRLQRRYASDIVAAIADEPNGIATWVRMWAEPGL